MLHPPWINKENQQSNQAVRLNHAVIGLTGEVGELAAALERALYYGRELDVTNIKEELGDCLWYIAQACNTLGLDLGAVMAANIRKLHARYPQAFVAEAEQHRDKTAERRAIEPIDESDRQLANDGVVES